MPRNISTALKNHLASENITVCTLLKTVLTNGLVLAFCDLDQDLVYNDGTGLRTYISTTGFNLSAMEYSDKLAVDNAEASGFLDPSLITLNDITSGIWDYAEVFVYRVNYKDLSMGHEVLNRGTIGNLSAGRIDFQSEIRGLSQSLQQQCNRSVQASCVATFGDNTCKKNKLDYTFNGSVTTAFNRLSFGTDLTQDVDYFSHGQITFLTGLNAGLSEDVKFFAGMPVYETLNQTSTITNGVVNANIPAGKTFSRAYGVVDNTGQIYTIGETPNSTGVYTPTSGGVYNFNAADEGKVVTITYAVVSYSLSTPGQIDLQLEMPHPIVVGDTFKVVAGCDKLVKTCGDKFSNIINFQGFPHMPGRDKLISGNS